MKLFYLFLLSFFLEYSHSSFMYSVDELFDTLYNLTDTEENYKIIIESLSETLNKVYAYNEIAKNPPQPEFDRNYHIKINIQEKLKNINTNNTNAYLFYREVKSVLCSLGDFHLNFDGKMIINNIHFIEPITLSIEEYENEYRMFGYTSIGESSYKNFKNHEKIFDIIEKNKNIPIKSINGKDPFDYVTYFGEPLKIRKNPQASFRFKFVSRNYNTLENFPLSKEELSNFTVVYDNGDKIETQYSFIGYINLKDNEFVNNNKFFLLNNKNEKISKNIFGLKKTILTDDINNIPKEEIKKLFIENNLDENKYTIIQKK